MPDIRAWLETRLGELAGFDFPEPAPQAAGRSPLPRTADYSLALAAAYRCIVGIPAAAPPIAPVLPEIVRFDPAGGIRFPPAIAERLERIRRAEIAAAYRSIKANDGRSRREHLRREAGVL